MINRAQAAERARSYLLGIDESLALMEQETQDEEFGWVFFCGSHDASEVLAGNAPFVVMRDTGEVRQTGTARPLEEYLVPIRVEWEQHRI